MKNVLILIVMCFIFGCNGDSNSSPSAPRITNLRVEPETICVGDKADIFFTLEDANDDEVVWGIGLSTGEHGGVNPSIGRAASGTTIATSFDAATSGRHSHTVRVRIVATDIGGLQGDPVEFDVFVFNC